VGSIVVAIPFWGMVPVYGLAFLLYAWAFAKNDPAIYRGGRIVLALAAFAHLFTLLNFGRVRGEWPPVSGGESLVILANSISFIYLYLEFRSSAHGLGIFATFIVLCFQIVGSIIGPALSVPEILRGVGFGPHVAFNITAFASFTIAAATALTYVLQYRQLRSLRPGPLLSRLPSLEQLDHMSHRSTLMGWVFLSMGLVLGAKLAEQVWGKAWQWDPKQCTTLLTWMIFGFALFLRRFRAWQGGKMAAVTIIGFLSIILAFVLFNGLLPSAHHFT